MKVRVDFKEFVRFLICIGIACIGYLYTLHTGSIF